MLRGEWVWCGVSEGGDGEGEEGEVGERVVTEAE
jgi:hypothetical protein